MRAVLDTNVLMSGVFFRGVPGAVLDALAEGKYALVASPLILAEYRRVADELGRGRRAVDAHAVLDALTAGAEIIEDTRLSVQVCRDRDDDVFLAAAFYARAALVSGDADLRAMDGWNGVRVLTPRQFLTTLRA